MANTLTGLIPVMYEGLDIVSREMCGLTRAVSLESKAENAAVGQTVRSHVAPTATTHDITPGTAPADEGSQNIGTVDVVITKAKESPILWTGEEQLSVGGQLNPILVDQFTQSIRALVNEVEVDLATTGYKGASRAYGTAGTTPFGTAGNLSDFAQVLKILEDNGAPQTDLHLGLGSSAIANIRGKQSGLFEVNRAGSDDLLRRGVIGDVQGLAIHNSYGIQTPASGTGSGYLVAASDLAIGDTTITVDTGSGTILAGDVVTFAGDANQYVVATALSGTTFTIAEPGLRTAVADNSAITVVGASTRNLGFARSALHLAARTPAMPKDSSGRPVDAALDVIDLTDPVSGITFQVAMYAQYRRVKYEVALAWGTKVVKSEHICALLG